MKITDLVWVPIVYHILFRDRDVTPDDRRSLVAAPHLQAGATAA